MSDRTDALNALSWPQLQKVASVNGVDASKKDAILDELEEIGELKVPDDPEIVAVFKGKTPTEDLVKASGDALKAAEKPKAPGKVKGERRKIEDVNSRGDWLDPFSGLRVYSGSVKCDQSGAVRDGDHAILPERG